MKDGLTPQELIDHFRQVLGEGLKDGSIVTQTEGLKKIEHVQVWLTIDKTLLRIAAESLIKIEFPHLSVISGCDTGDSIDLMYHFALYYGKFNSQYNVTFKLAVPKTDLTVDTISDMIPGAVTSEREKMEFFGLTVVDIPDNRRMFLPESFPDGVYPWRKDETGIKEEMVKKLHEVGKEEGQQRRLDKQSGNKTS